ncbi:MAG: hypothetical protein IPL46_33120 [Saprospiraceae bacterium]|nr:hypothetical protein [Saprospiraceae bacterium]
MYFEANTLENEQRSTFDKLRTMQLPDGGFSWFPDGPSNWFISLYIAEGLIQMSDWLGDPRKGQVNTMIDELLVFLDQSEIRYYKELERQVEKGNTTWDEDHLSPSMVYNLYIRSLRASGETPGENPIFDYFMSQAKKYWIDKSVYSQAQLSQVFTRYLHPVEQKKIIASLRERMISKPDLGAYWKESNGFAWWDMPVATQSKMIEVFSEEGDNATVNELKRWLLSQKRTNHWSTTKATSEAVRSLTLGPTNWLSEAKPVEVMLNDGKRIDMLDDSEAGSFRQKITFTPDEVEGIKSLVFKNPNEQPAWGAAYFQYFDDLDQVKGDSEGPLDIRKQLFYRLSLTRDLY